MISDNVEEECKKILLMLSNENILAIKDTVTNKMVAATTIEEAIDAIVTYSTSAEELLARKKLKREVLFQYAHIQRIPEITASLAKPELISKITQWWEGKKLNFSESKSMKIAPNNQSIDTGQALAREFIHWFYPMLNNLTRNPVQSSSEWRSGHFWPDASVTIQRNDYCEKYIANEEGYKKLASVIMQDRLVLNVNDHKEGYRGVMSAHGLAKVAVCGTIHQLTGIPSDSGRFVGVFEQAFGLLRDPTEHNHWKIKYTELQMRVIQNTQIQTPYEITLSDTIMKAICSE